jgi:putative endonuclease
MTSRQSLGRWGETRAAEYLTSCGYTLLERNVRTPYGEIDLVTLYEGQVVFVEVKTRASHTLGPPEVSITPTKKTHMVSAGLAYLQSHPDLGEDWRIDVIAILRLPGPGGAVTEQIEHFENVIISQA